MPLLSELVRRAHLPVAIAAGEDVVIHSLTADSREVRPGALFFAMPGVKADGAQFVPQAIANGAAAIIAAPDAALGSDIRIPVVPMADMREAVSALAAAFFPQQPEHVFAITGTDGKTSTADFVRQLAQFAGRRSASIGTLGLRSPEGYLNETFPANNTSPEPILLHRTLQQLAAAEIECVAIETSSHGLEQKRVDHVKFAAAAFTNLTRDHLDYHGTEERYFAAKARLFSSVMEEGSIAVLNRDDAKYERLRTLCLARNLRVISFGYHDDATYRIMKVMPHAEGLHAVLRLRGEIYRTDLPLYGAFQLSNILAAMGLLQQVGLQEGYLINFLPQLKNVPGRLERIYTHHGVPIFVDYAHTPAALENILKTLRPHVQHRLHVVFGCGGDRDAGKREPMGAAALRYADHVIVTDDNPRSEDPAAIRAAILKGVPGAQEIGDRRAAIHAAVQQIQAGDILVVAGKGHETTQTIGDHVIHFNDAEIIREAVAA